MRRWSSSSRAYAERMALTLASSASNRASCMLVFVIVGEQPGGLVINMQDILPNADRMGLKQINSQVLQMHISFLTILTWSSFFKSVLSTLEKHLSA